MTPRYEIKQGDVLDRLRELPAEYVHCVCCSPPYYGLRDYKTEGQIGCEKTLDCLGWATGQKCGECHICVIVSVFREVRRVLRKDGTLWLNYGDCYCGSTSETVSSRKDSPIAKGTVSSQEQRQGRGERTKNLLNGGLKPKDLCMVPARIALALQADGWWLRSEIIWAKGNPMPESVTDRPTSAHEKIYLLSKSERYYYDADAVREKAIHGDPTSPRGSRGSVSPNAGLRKQDALGKQTYTGFNDRYEPLQQRNLRNVWNLNTEPYPAAHFATYPTAIPKRAILAGTSEKGVCVCCGAGWRRVVDVSYSDANRGMVGNQKKVITDSNVMHAGRGNDKRMNRHTETLGWQPSCDCGEEETIPATVLDPFLGSGTTVAVALMLGRRGIGIELNEEYVKLAEERIAPYAAQEILRF